MHTNAPSTRLPFILVDNARTPSAATTTRSAHRSHTRPQYITPSTQKGCFQKPESSSPARTCTQNFVGSAGLTVARVHALLPSPRQQLKASALCGHSSAQQHWQCTKLSEPYQPLSCYLSGTSKAPADAQAASAIPALQLS